MSHLCERREKFLLDLVWRILWSHWSIKFADVVGIVVPCVGFVDGWLPFDHRGAGQVAERTQIQVSWVTQSGIGKNIFWFSFSFPPELRWCDGRGEGCEFAVSQAVRAVGLLFHVSCEFPCGPGVTCFWVLTLDDRFDIVFCYQVGWGINMICL